MLSSINRLYLLGNSILMSEIQQELMKYSSVSVEDEFNLLKNTAKPDKDILVSVNDRWNTENDLHFQKKALDNQIPYLRIYLDFNQLVIGPMVRPNIPGCIACSETRSYEASKNKYYYEILTNIKKMIFGKELYPRHHIIIIISQIIIYEIKRIEKYKSFPTSHEVYYYDFEKMKGEFSKFIYDSYCSYCSTLPDDEPEEFHYKLKENLKEDATQTRIENKLLTLENLHNLMVDKRLGIVTKTHAYENKILSIVTSEKSQFHDDQPNHTVGREKTFHQSEITSLLESMERQAGGFPQRRRTHIYDTYFHLQNKAINPQSLGLYTEEQHNEIDFPYERFDNNKSLQWVWGYSYKNNHPILVPEQAAYFSIVKESKKEKRFIGDSSNGCALGGSFEEACLYGLFEVLERDAFLMMWHAKLPVSAIDLKSINDLDIIFIKEKIESMGYFPFVFNTTTDFGVPCVCAFIVNKEHNTPRFFLAASCNLNPIKAINSCLLEAAAHTEIASQIYLDKMERIEELYNNPKLINRIEDHYLYYYHPNNFHHIDFILKRDISYVNFNDAFKKNCEESLSLDLSKDLKRIINIIIEKGYDVISVDQTPEYYKSINLHAVKVIVPGTLSLGFGYNNTRVLKLKRLFEAHILMNYSEKMLGINDINQSPHPFP